MHRLQKFASVHASVHNHVPTERHLQNRNIYKQTRVAAFGPSGAVNSPHKGQLACRCGDWFAFV